MAVMQMQRVGICGLNSYRKDILERLQILGVMEIDEVDIDNEGVTKADTSNIRSNIIKDAHQAEKALEIIDLYAPRPKAAFESFNGKRVLNNCIYREGSNLSEKLKDISVKLVDIDRDILANKADIVRLQNQIEELTPWLDLDVEFDYSGTRDTEFFLGTIPEDISEREIEERLKAEAGELDLYSIIRISSSQDMTYIAVLALNKEKKALEEALRRIGFARSNLSINEIPAEAKERMEREIAETDRRVDLLKGEVAGYSENYDDLRMYVDYNNLRAKKYEVLGCLPQTRNAFALEGYVPAEYVGSLKAEMSECNAVVEVRDIGEDEEAPVLFKNKWFAAVGEDTVESFGLPNKKEMDPSGIMMIFYVIFFGLMLSDAAYGAVLSIATGVMLIKFPRMGKGMKNLLKLFFLCGFSTIFWGVMFGGYFGDVVDIVAKTFFGVRIPEGQTLIPALWFVPLNDPMKMLIYALLFGVIHMFTGLVLGAYQNLKNKNYMGFFVDNVCTGLFILGLIFMLLPTSLFESIAQMEFNFPPTFVTASKIMTLIGFLGILFFSGRESKNPGIRIALGLYDIYNNVSGWLSDTLSYSRLLALGLATGVIASVVNQMGSMSGSGFIGVIIFLIIFVVGHVFNLGINILGAYVHTCRLQYVEFFGKFYEGGGRKFTPYFADTKYVEVKGGK